MLTISDIINIVNSKYSYKFIDDPSLIKEFENDIREELIKATHSNDVTVEIRAKNRIIYVEKIYIGDLIIIDK